MLSRLASNSIITQFAVNALSKTQKHDRYLLFNTTNSEFLIDAIEGMLVNYYEPSSYSKDVSDAYMIILFSELLKAFQQKQSSEHRKADHSYIGDILLFIEKNYQDCSLQQIADTFKFNPSYLSRFIKSQTGEDLCRTGSGTAPQQRLYLAEEYRHPDRNHQRTDRLQERHFLLPEIQASL